MEAHQVEAGSGCGFWTQNRAREQRTLPWDRKIDCSIPCDLVLSGRADAACSAAWLNVCVVVRREFFRVQRGASGRVRLRRCLPARVTVAGMRRRAWKGQYLFQS